MLNIFATTFMTATRTDKVPMRPVPPEIQRQKRKWLPAGHWWLSTPSLIDPKDL